ncbi:50S ribosomal protein L29 [Candidatus Saccharibacteria bacterium]|nr:50S ribosomal protein L29 [Candidatus Saccharibacteria bacterium]
MKLKTLTPKDLRGKKPAELDAYLLDLQKQQVELTHLLSINKDKQTHQVSIIKRAIAQVKTVQTQVAQGKEK